MFCVQSCSRRCACPTLRLTAAETASQWFAAVAPIRYSRSSGQPTSSSDANSSGCAAYSLDGITSGRPASSSGATNSYWPAFSCGVTTWAGLPAPPAGPPLAAGVEGEFCCSTVFCHHATSTLTRCSCASLPSPSRQRSSRRSRRLVFSLVLAVVLVVAVALAMAVKVNYF